MRNVVNQLEKFTVLRTIFYLAFGILILMNPHLVFKSVIYIIAGYLAVLGLINLYQAIRESKNESLFGYEFITGVMLLLFALIVLIFAKAIVSFLPVMLGILIVLNGLMQLSNASGIKEVNPRYRISIYVYCGLLVAAGILLIFNPFKTVLIVFRLFGGILVFMGITELVHFFFQKRVN
ncbi:DUF308 domain-containing protein [uncultured Vagococcus sp.]|uniref:HdeD family acid-resistance protein n=1 Tax=uncultured Vagococcus sp. TaxID=189676 RepID=UPI0028D09CB1|nr:DUF308 domain-containing protein [uncultured Vagococcus sp.]